MGDQWAEPQKIRGVAVPVCNASCACAVRCVRCPVRRPAMCLPGTDETCTLVSVTSESERTMCAPGGESRLKVQP